MAITTEFFSVNGQSFVRTCSDAGRYVVRDGVSYAEACDPSEFGRTYSEGAVMPVNESDIADKAAAYDILVGVSE